MHQNNNSKEEHDGYTFVFSTSVTEKQKTDAATNLASCQKKHKFRTSPNHQKVISDHLEEILAGKVSLSSQRSSRKALKDALTISHERLKKCKLYSEIAEWLFSSAFSIRQIQKKRLTNLAKKVCLYRSFHVLKDFAKFRQKIHQH